MYRGLPPFGTLSLADPDLVTVTNAERAQRLSNLTGDSGIVPHQTRLTIQNEITAVITAMYNTGVLSFLPNKLPGVISAVTQYRKI